VQGALQGSPVKSYLPSIFENFWPGTGYVQPVRSRSKPRGPAQREHQADISPGARGTSGLKQTIEGRGARKAWADVSPGAAESSTWAGMGPRLEDGDRPS